MTTKEIRRSAEGRIGGWNKTVCDLRDEVDRLTESMKETAQMLFDHYGESGSYASGIAAAMMLDADDKLNPKEK